MILFSRYCQMEYEAW